MSAPPPTSSLCIATAHQAIADTGTYRHTPQELAFGARVAWRNANRCIGRLYWRSLHVRDLRDVRDADGVAEACAGHLRDATRDGRIRPMVTVFAPDEPGRPGPRIWNEQLVRYAGYTRPDGRVTGAPRNTGITALALRLGWPGGPGTPFDVLPLLVQGTGDDAPRCFGLPDGAVLEVPLSHPEYTWWRSLGLRWHAVPALADMCLEIGGTCYPAAPFNGWYMGTEIGARNLAGPRPRRAEPLGTALLRPRRGHRHRPPHRVPALPRPSRPRGAQGPPGGRRLVVDRAADPAYVHHAEARARAKGVFGRDMTELADD